MKTKVIRKPLIAGNWKMNKNVQEAVNLAEEIVEKVGRQTDANVVICPPFTALAGVAKAIEGSNIQLGAQNLYPASSGAFTGEVSPEMLRDLFVTHAIVGHSERRTLFHETNAFINKKVLAALATNLKPILCLGETLEQHEVGDALKVVQQQLLEALKDVQSNQIENIIIAYEPVWAIGTGKTATPTIAQEVHFHIRKTIADLYSPAKASKIRILYGGSMNPTNAQALLAMPDIDGALIGGAALEAKSFVKIIENAL